MYQIISAVAQPIAPGSAWAPVDTSGKSISALFSEYTDIYFTVSHPFWNHPKIVILSQIKHRIDDLGQTIQAFLTSIGNTNIEAIDGTLSLKTGRVLFCDAFYAGYKISRGIYEYNPEHVPDHTDANSLVMKKAGVDPHEFQRNCLLSVNGLLYPVVADDTHIYARHACESLNYCYRNEVGVVNFRGVGGVKTIAITEQMIHRLHPDQPMANQVLIEAKDVDFTDKTVGLVFGGYLTLLDSNLFVQNSADSFVLDVQNFDLIERYFESKKIIDTKFLGLALGGADGAQISREQLYSDEVITRWLSHHLSYLVVIDTDNLSVNTKQLRETKTFNQYIAYEEPVVPIVYESGLMPPYWKQYDEGYWSVGVAENIRANYLYHKTTPDMAPMPADNREPYKPDGFYRAYLLEIATSKVVIE